MRLSLDWLAEFVDLPPEADLVFRLDMGGFEDSTVERTGPDLRAIRVGRVLERAAHPNADRLSLCRVEVGEDEPLEIVCGAPNVAAGQKVAVALPGTRFPDGNKLKKTKIRGVASNGMICSARELGLGDDHEGILVLDREAPVGASLPDVIETGDRILEVGITPNRGDTASLLGLAREVRAHFGGPLRIPESEPPESGAPAADSIRVSIDAPDDCHRYVARIVRGVRVGPSPEWVRRRLEASGVRPINNVVDVTNLVLLEYGQPLHGFDLATLRGGMVRVRRARPGESLATLDGRTVELGGDDLVIADSERPIALAGVMGGSETEVGDRTTDVLIESAHFHPTTVRLGARRHGLRTEASYRFERGVDRAGVERAADRAARLLAELAGGEVATGRVVAEGAPPAHTQEIALDPERMNRLLGTSIARDEVVALLARVGIEAKGGAPGALACRIPPHRNDLHLPEDLTEEVARIHGYDRIPTTEPFAQLHPVRLPESWTLADRARDALAGAGLLETVSVPFLTEGEAFGLGLGAEDRRAHALRLANPIRDEEPWLRTSLLPSLLRLVRQNRSRQIDPVRLFEVSRVFWPREAGELPDEPLQVGAVLTRRAEPRLWEPPSPPPLFFEARGVAERLLFALSYPGIMRSIEASEQASRWPYLHPGAAARIEVGGTEVGAVGELHPSVAARFEIDVPCAAIELDLSVLVGLERHRPRFRDVSRQPQVRRDLALLVDRAQPAAELQAAIRKTAGSDLVLVEPFDRYEGKGVPEGRVSLAFRLVFQRADRTLTDAEVQRAMERVVEMLTRRFGAELR